jgi:hypothetical protein
MPASAPYPPAETSAADLATARSIRFAVYLTGGLVMFAFGLLNVSSTMGQVLSCLFQTESCSNGFTQVVYFDTVPVLVAGSLMVVIALVLFVFAYRNR